MYPRWYPEFYDLKVEPYILFSQEYNLYYLGYGPNNTMARRSYPATTGIDPLHVYDFAQLKFTFGDALGHEPDGVFSVWDLAGDHYRVEVKDDILVVAETQEPLQEQGLVAEDFLAGTQDDMGIPDGKVKIGAVMYTFYNGAPLTPLEVDVPKDTLYKVYAKAYCYQYVNIDDASISFPGSAWSLRPLSYHSLIPLGAAAYADSHWNPWLFPLPFPQHTHSNDERVIKDNGWVSLMMVPSMQYDRDKHYWENTFPMAHDINTPLHRGFIRNDPLIVKLRKSYRVHCENHV